MNRRHFTASSFAFLTSLATSCQAQASDKPAPEVGLVTWGRDYSKAMKESKTSGKPVFLFFQEVPG